MNKTEIDSEGNVRIHLDVSFKRLSGRRRMIEVGTPDEIKKSAPFAQALALATNWVKLLETGRFSSVLGIARAIGVEPCYIRRRLPLAFLSPTIMKMITLGKLPDDMTLTELGVLGKEPVWAKQHKLLGID